MAGNEAQVVGAELERVLPKVPTLFDRDDTFYSALEKRPVEVISSRDMRVPLELRPGGKSGYYNPDGQDLGRGDMPYFDKAIVSSAHLRHAVEFTTKTMWSTDNNRKAVVNAFRHNLATAMKEFRRQVDGQCMGSGDGVIGTITTASTSGGVDTYTLTTDGFGAKLVRFGQDLAVYDPTLATKRQGPLPNNETTVQFHDLANKTIKVGAVTGVQVGDKLVFSGLTGAPPVGLYGIRYHNSNASAGTWLGFDRSLTPEIRANRVNGNGAALTLPGPRLAVNMIGDRVGYNHKKKLTAWTHPAQKAAYEELGFPIMRIDKTGSSEEGMNMYFNDNMQLAGAPLKCSYNWDRTRIDFIDLDVWGRGELHPAGFYTNPDNNQRVWEIRGSSGGIATAWIFYIVASFQVFMTNPAASSYMDNLAVPAGY